jgi:hypothetical protein
VGAGTIQAYFNNDSGSNYRNFPNYTDSVGNNLSDNSGTIGYLQYCGSTTPGSGVVIAGWFEIEPVGNTVIVTGFCVFQNGGPTWISEKLSSVYTGSSPLSQFNPFSSAMFIGLQKLEVLGAAKP